MTNLSRRKILQNFLTAAFSLSALGLPRVTHAEEDPMAKFDRMEQEAFSDFEDMVEESFAELERVTREAFLAAKRKISTKWGKKETFLPSPKVWVGYNEDKTSRIIVDDEKGIVKIETITDIKTIDQQTQRLSAFGKQAMTAGGAETNAMDPVFSALKPALERRPQGVTPDSVYPDKGMAYLISKDVSGKQALYIVQKVIHKKSNLKSRPAKTPSGRNKKIITTTIPMRKDYKRLNEKRVSAMVFKEAGRFKLPLELVYAIIKNESAFNPRAMSPVPAFGLMQLVPRSGAADAYKFVYKENAIVDMNYLLSATK